MDQPTTELTSETIVASPKKGFAPPRWLMLTIASLVITIVSYFVQKSLLFNNTAVSAEVKEVREPEKQKTPDKEKEIVLLDELIVNPAETAGRRYLSVTIGLQIAAKEAEKEVEKSKPLIRDALISLLSSKHLDQLSRISYRDTLKDEMRDVINKKLKDLQVDQVIFNGYVLQ